MADPATRTLLAILENQAARTDAALEALDDASLGHEPGGGCNSLLRIGRHLVMLRRFQLGLLGSDAAGEVEDETAIETIDDLRHALGNGLALVRSAIEAHDPEDWFRVPAEPRTGHWGDEPTLLRLVRPLNDFTNHLGAIRAIRRQLGHEIPRTQ